jgi:hypothetical protein
MTDERDPILEPFDALVGTWETESTHPLIDGVAPGTMTFECLEGRRFLILRYGAALEDGVLRFWRDDPTFAQRFVATLDPESFVGQWQVAETPGDWKDDVRLVLRRR